MGFIYSFNRLTQFTVSLWFKPDGTGNKPDGTGNKPDGTGNQQGLLSNGWECDEQGVPEEASIKILYAASEVSAFIQTNSSTGGVMEDTVGGVMVNIYFNVTEYSFIYLIISTNNKNM